MNKFSFYFCLLCVVCILAGNGLAQETTLQQPAEEAVAQTAAEVQAPVQNTEVPIPVPAKKDKSMVSIYDGLDELKEDGGDLSVSAERMEMHVGETLILEENVVVQDRVKSLTADRVVVYLSEKNEPTKIEATGRVRFDAINGETSATGDHCIYFCEEENKIVDGNKVKERRNEIILDGNCTVKYQDRVMKSEQVVYNLNTGAISVKRSVITLPMNTLKNDFPQKEKSVNE